MSKKKPQQQAESGRRDFEKSLAELESIVRRLEDGQIGLADAMKSYEQGIVLLKQCYKNLDQVERRIELLSGIDAEGNPIIAPFDDGAEGSSEEKSASSAGRRRGTKTKKGKRAAKPADETDDGESLF